MTDQTDVTTGGSRLPWLATICGLAAAVVCTLVLTAVHTGPLHDHLGRAATVLAISAIVLGGLAILDRRVASLYGRHRAERAEAEARHRTELRAADERHQGEMRAAEERHERDVQHHLGVLERVLADRSQAEARSREQGRAEVAELARVKHRALTDQHQAELADAAMRAQAELEQATKEAEERGEARGYARGLDAAARIDAEESAPHAPGIVRRIPPPR